MAQPVPSHPPSGGGVPLCVDLDGTLIRSDMLWEALMQLLHSNPVYVFRLPIWLLRGRAYFKKQIAQRVQLDVSVLPYNEHFLEFLRAEHERGRPLVLATAADQSHAQQVVHHLGLPMEVLGSDGGVNLKGETKARLLTERFGHRGFDYAGDAGVDLAIWRQAREAIVVNARAGLARKVRAVTTVSHVFNEAKPWWQALVKAIRPHQWVKNLIIFVPLFGAHKEGNLVLLGDTLLAFAAFSLCASGAYVMNDVWDVESDRHHAGKKNRPFASGQFSLPFGVALSGLCLCLSIAVAVGLPGDFLWVLAVYFVLTTAYSWRLKQVVLLDVFVLAGLYTIRLEAGQAATGIENSFWLLAFSLFIFLSLALAKRFTELYGLRQQSINESRGRGYRATDLELVATCGIVSGFLAALVVLLYVHSQEVIVLYRRPNLLLLVCPLMLYWISHVWLAAHRGKMHDDPIVFALTDRPSWLIGLILAAVALAASPI
jgi:4-hydroxybenzoate polyprenyltransferase